MHFKCNNCGGDMVYNPDHQGMYCENCDGVNTETQVEGSHTCANCGAPLEISQYATTAKCEHCGCHHVIDERIAGDYTPHAMLPFTVSKEQAKQRFKENYKRYVFLPDNFLKDVTLSKMQGYYVPFWLYDFNASYHYEGEGRRVRSWTSGDMHYTETSYYRIIRDMDIDYDMIPADASIAMPDGTMDLMEPYNYSTLIAFDPKFLAGFEGEYYNFTPQELEGRAKDKAAKYADKMMSNTITGYASVIPSVKDLRLSNQGVRYALFPVWKQAYSYGGKEYEVYVNGQTGKIVGNVPVSKAKMFWYTVGGLLIWLAIFWCGFLAVEMI